MAYPCRVAIDSGARLIRRTERVGVVTRAAMLKESLLPIVQEEALRLGLKPLKDRTWQDWLDEGLIMGPTPQGVRRGINPLWDYPGDTLDRALTIVRLKTEGTKRNSQLRVQLWLRGYDLPERSVVRDLAGEFRRLLKRQFFRRPWAYDSAERGAENKRQRQKRKLAAVDGSVEAMRPSDDLILDLGSRLFWASGKDEIFDLLINQLANTSGISRQQFIDIFSPFRDRLNCLAGLFGDPEEIEKSGLSQLDDLSRHDLVKGREFYAFVIHVFDQMASNSSDLTPPLESEKAIDAIKISRSFQTADWSILVGGIGALVSLRQRASTS